MSIRAVKKVVASKPTLEGAGVKLRRPMQRRGTVRLRRIDIRPLAYERRQRLRITILHCLKDTAIALRCSRADQYRQKADRHQRSAEPHSAAFHVFASPQLFASHEQHVSDVEQIELSVAVAEVFHGQTQLLRQRILLILYRSMKVILFRWLTLRCRV